MRTLHTRKLLALDMDGTVLTDQKIVTERTIRAIRAALDRGVIVVPASGRTLETLPPELLGIPGIRYVITCNGARVVDQVSGQVISRQLLPLDTVLELLDDLQRRDCVLEASIEDRLYVSSADVERELSYVAPTLRPYMEKLHVETPDLRKLLRERGLDSEKVLVFVPDEAELQWMRHHLEPRQDLAVSFSVKNNLEINAAGTSKGSGLDALTRYLGLSREEVMVCGDSGNDLSMMEFAGFAVAMGNAVPEIRELADAVTMTNNEDGVAVAIERHLLAQEA